jgi:hypothetical protein
MAMLAKIEVAGRLDKINMIGAFRNLLPYLSTIWQTTCTGPTLTATRRGLNRVVLTSPRMPSAPSRPRLVSPRSSSQNCTSSTQVLT